MCGIVGSIRKKNNVIDFLINGLKCLEYRGYDSAGICVILKNKFCRIRKVGRVSLVQDELKKQNLFSLIGLGHTRWATHGLAIESNAHPQISNNLIAVVHNGIIENFVQEKKRLELKGYKFESQTDTEVIAHSIYDNYIKTKDLFLSVKLSCKRFKGSYAISVICSDFPNQMVAARMGCPLLLSINEEGVFVASDASVFIPYSKNVIYLEDGDIANLTSNGVDKILDKNFNLVSRVSKVSKLSLSSIELGSYNHFMQKEIFEQPKAIFDTLKEVYSRGFNSNIFGDKAEYIFKDINNIKILACGTSYYAGIVAKYWLESIAKISTDVEISSEYRYRKVIHNPKELVITISQSGETLDTIEALKYAKSLGYIYSLCICNTMESSLARISDLVFYTKAGVEIGVASTKGFTTQLTALFILTISIGAVKGFISNNDQNLYLESLRLLPAVIEQTLYLEKNIIPWAKLFASEMNILFLGRGLHYPIALEGSLKFKEITYIHAEAYPAGELKHGPLALVDGKMPIVILAPNNELLNKLKSNIKEIESRGGHLFIFTDYDSDLYEDNNINIIKIPKNMGILSPIVYSIPVQLLAYNTALIRKTDIDKPRNLAKSVTVE